VLSKRCYKQEWRIGELLEKVGGEVKEDVAMSKRGVADKEEVGRISDHVMVSHIVAFGDKDVVVSGVAGTIVVVLEEEEEEARSLVALMRLLEGVKRRKLDGDGGGVKGTKDLAVVKVLLGPREVEEREDRVASWVPTWPRRQVGSGFDSFMRGQN